MILIQLISLNENTNNINTNMNNLKEGDKVLFDCQILTLDKFDTWWGIWTFVEKSYAPVEYQKYNEPIKLAHSFSGIKKLLNGLGFHYLFGYYVSNKNKLYCIRIETTINKIYFDMSKNGNYFDLDNDRVIIDKKNIDLQNIKNQIMQYFN